MIEEPQELPVSWTCETKFEYDDRRDWFTDNLADAIRISKNTEPLEIHAIFRDSDDGVFTDEDNNDRYTWVTIFKDEVPSDIERVKIRFRAESELYFIMFTYTFKKLTYNSGRSKQFFNKYIAANYTINIEMDRYSRDPFWR